MMFINCKKQNEEVKTIPNESVCDYEIDNFIIKSKSNKKLDNIFLDYWLKMSKSEYEAYSKNYIKKDILKGQIDTLWIHFPNKTDSEYNQFLEIKPTFENDTLIGLTLYSPRKNKDYNHYGSLISKYGKPNSNLYCQFLHRAVWKFKNAIIEYTEPDTDVKPQIISYLDIEYAKKKSQDNLEFREKEEQKRILEERKTKDSIAKRKKIIDNAL